MIYQSFVSDLLISSAYYIVYHLLMIYQSFANILPIIYQLSSDYVANHLLVIYQLITNLLMIYECNFMLVSLPIVCQSFTNQSRPIYLITYVVAMVTN